MEKKEILIVDDQPGIRLLLTDILESIGYTVTTAENGKETLHLLEKMTFDLIILDYKLPLVDGSEVLQQMEERKIPTPAIIMSGLAENMEEEIQNYPRVKKILAKPFNIHDFCQEVNNILSS
ncbi:response regulator [Compostibacillus humi]|uniref:Response regulator n=1 Tax=Compostibacillus humi TaxID=1245525 RepID=A0A8J2ZQC0_9BACI|nr:response regulator [Compostibacillus humi]GGH71220.1 response regulator [Compostibacillus humi]HLT55827.1 response regulator [Bacillota bacterium]